MFIISYLKRGSALRPCVCMSFGRSGYSGLSGHTQQLNYCIKLCVAVASLAQIVWERIIRLAPIGLGLDGRDVLCASLARENTHDCTHMADNWGKCFMLILLQLSWASSIAFATGMHCFSIR